MFKETFLCESDNLTETCVSLCIFSLSSQVSDDHVSPWYSLDGILYFTQTEPSTNIGKATVIKMDRNSKNKVSSSLFRIILFTVPFGTILQKRGNRKYLGPLKSNSGARRVLIFQICSSIRFWFTWYWLYLPDNCSLVGVGVFLWMYLVAMKLNKK